MHHQTEWYLSGVSTYSYNNYNHWANKQPGWKVKRFKGVVSRIVQCWKRPCENAMRKRLEKNYSRELKQDIKTQHKKIKQVTERNKQYRKNKMFVNNQRQFYRSLETKSGDTNITSDNEEIKEFWEDIWSVEAKHNPRASWIGKVRTEIGTVQQQEDLSITVEDVRSVLWKVSKWKAARPNGV